MCIIKLYLDNYYTSPTLFLKLYTKQIYACGTARTHRKQYPSELIYKDFEASKLNRVFFVIIEHEAH